MNRSYITHTGENTQTPIPWRAGEEPARTVYRNPDKVTISESLLDITSVPTFNQTKSIGYWILTDQYCSP